MRNDTRAKFTAYLATVAALNGIPDATAKFAVAPTIEQVLEKKIRESAAFLQRVNVYPVAQQSGEKLGLGITSPIAGRTNTNAADRPTRSIWGMDGRSYFCHQTNFDTHIRYSTLDAWAKFPDFQTRVRNQTVEQIARDRLMIGWNGTSVAAQTDLQANPLLQDVNIGWLEQIRLHAPDRRMDAMKVGTEAGSDYQNLDAMVTDMVNELMDEWHTEATDLVVIMGRGLLNEKMMALINGAEAKATEHQALQTLMLNRTVGGKRAISVPYFPARSVLITSESNLSIYWQEGTRRRTLTDNPKRDRIEDYNSINECYVVEDYGKVAFAENVQLHDGTEWA
jgi:P2 family phage major capsid protein